MLITLTGNIPSKKNGKRIVSFGGRPSLIASKAYGKWHPTAFAQLADGKVPRLNHPSVKKMTITFFDKLNIDGSKPKRLFDLSNKAESVMDLLVDYRYLSDDNYTVVPDLHLKFGGYNKKQGCEIKVTDN